MELLADPAPFDLDDPSWPIHTAGGSRGPARVFSAARVSNALVSPGAHVYGVVEHSVIGPGVTIEEGATVRDSVLLHDTVVCSGATVERAVIDAEVRVERQAQIGGPDGDGRRITLVGQGVTVSRDQTLPSGSRFPDSPDA